jgi:hypothetical protein
MRLHNNSEDTIYWIAGVPSHALTATLLPALTAAGYMPDTYTYPAAIPPHCDCEWRMHRQATYVRCRGCLMSAAH